MQSLLCSGSESAFVRGNSELYFGVVIAGCLFGSRVIGT